MQSKHPLSVIQHTLMRSYRDAFFSASCHGISREMALLCLPGFCSFPNGSDSVMYKPCVYKYSESASALVDLTNEQDAYFATPLCQLNTKGLSGFARLIKYKLFNELWKLILTGAKTVCGMTERKVIWHNSPHLWTNRILHLNTVQCSIHNKADFIKSFGCFLKGILWYFFCGIVFFLICF